MSPSKASGRDCLDELRFGYESLGASDILLEELMTDLARSKSFSDTPNVSVWCRFGRLVLISGYELDSLMSRKLLDRVRVYRSNLLKLVKL